MVVFKQILSSGSRHVPDDTTVICPVHRLAAQVKRGTPWHPGAGQGQRPRVPGEVKVQ